MYDIAYTMSDKFDAPRRVLCLSKESSFNIPSLRQARSLRNELFYYLAYSTQPEAMAEEKKGFLLCGSSS